MFDPHALITGTRRRPRPGPAAPPPPLRLDAPSFRFLLRELGPSLGLWRAAEVAALREVAWEPPVLDLGCGDGLVASLVFGKIDIGIDPDIRAIGKADRLGIYDRLLTRRAEDAEIGDASVGTIASNSVLEHVPAIGDVLAAAARVLRPGGSLVFTAPTDAFSSWLAVPLRPYASWRNAEYGHINLWTVERWARELDRAGLRLERVRPYLRRSLVTGWDLLDLLQRPRLGRRRLFGLLWRRLPPGVLDRLARRAAGIDLAAPPPGGGRLIVARKA